MLNSYCCHHLLDPGFASANHLCPFISFLSHLYLVSISSIPDSKAMSSVLSGRRRRPQEFTLPSGKKVITTLPEDLEDLRRKYSNQDEMQVEIVIHGSPEHSSYLRETREHHERRRTKLREEHGPAFAEWEDVQNRLNSVNSELERLSTNSAGLNANFNKFGYHADVRTYDGDEEAETAPASSAASMSDTLSVASSRSGARLGETTKLFKRPVVKQWFHQGLLWRASEQAEIQAIELFFDLLYGTSPNFIMGLTR